MKKTLVTLLLAILCFGLQANPVDVQKAKLLGTKFMKANTEMKSASTDLAYTAYADNGQTAFYVFAVQPKGFVIVSADDRAKPILGYSTESNFTPQLPDGLMTFSRTTRLVSVRCMPITTSVRQRLLPIGRVLRRQACFQLRRPTAV